MYLAVNQHIIPSMVSSEIVGNNLVAKRGRNRLVKNNRAGNDSAVKFHCTFSVHGLSADKEVLMP